MINRKMVFAALVLISISAQARFQPAQVFLSSDTEQAQVVVVNEDGEQVTLAGQRLEGIYQLASKNDVYGSLKTYSTSTGDVAVMKVMAKSQSELFYLRSAGEHGEVASRSIQLLNLTAVKEVDVKLLQPLIAKQGADQTFAELEQVVEAASVKAATVESEEARNTPRVILVDGNYDNSPSQRQAPPQNYNQGYDQGYNQQPQYGFPQQQLMMPPPAVQGFAFGFNAGCGVRCGQWGPPPCGGCGGQWGPPPCGGCGGQWGPAPCGGCGGQWGPPPCGGGCGGCGGCGAPPVVPIQPSPGVPTPYGF